MGRVKKLSFFHTPFFYIRELKEMVFKVKLKRRVNIGKETCDYEIFSSVRFTYWH